MAETPAPRVGTAVATGDAFQLGRRDLLRWLYLGRLTLVTGILAGAFLQWFEAAAEVTLVATVLFLVALVATTLSFWYTHILGREPNENFLYAQVVFDVAIVTGIVHITAGPESSFAPVYILVISAGALLLPLPGGVLIGGLASIAYFADLVWGFQGNFNPQVGAQIALFTVVALVTGRIGDRVRRAGMELGEVESELHQLRLDTSDILANLQTGVLTVDGQGRLAYVNPAGAELLGIDAEAWLGRPVLEELERVAPGMGGLLQGSIHQGRSVERFRTTATHPDGERLRLGVSTAVLARSADEPNSTTAIFQDITDLERLDELHLRAERLEAVAALSASLAHEIKNPLASIRSSVEQLSGPRPSEADRRVLERLVLTESDRLSRLLSEFLDYSVMRIGARRELDLEELISQCVAVARQHPDLAQTELVVRTDPDPPRFIGDGDLLHRALLNLILNAAQSSGNGGRVVVRAGCAGEEGRPRGTGVQDPVHITVRDSGPGVDPETAARIFDPFFTTRQNGSGLGLAVVHRAVEAHHGVILVEDAPGGGARFVILLPGLPRDGGRT